MPLPEEVKALLGETYTEAQLLEMLEPEAQSHLESKGRIIRTKEEDDSYIGSQVEAKIKDQVSNIHKRYDDDLFELTGERKAPTEKTYEFVKRKITDLKKSAEGKGEGVDKDKLAELQKALEEAKNDKENSLKEVNEKFFKKVLNTTLSGELDKATIAVPGHLKTDDEKQNFVSIQKRMLVKDFLETYTAKEDEEGNIVYYIGDKIQVDIKDGKPLSASDLIAKNYSHYFVKSERQQGGAGTGKNNSEGVFKTLGDLHDYLVGQGISESSKEYSEKKLKLAKDHGIL